MTDFPGEALDAAREALSRRGHHLPAEDVRAALMAALPSTAAYVIEQVADEASFVIANGDVAEVAAPSGLPETGRGECIDARDRLLEEPVMWLRQYRRDWTQEDPEPQLTYDDDLPPF